MISVLIPSRNEQFLQRTIDDVLSKAEGDIEVVVTLDGYWPNPIIKTDKRVVIIHHGTAKGMRASINAGVAVSSNAYLLKCDAHCMFDQGFDTKLLQDIESNWIVVPRRYRLDPDNWVVIEDGRPPIDYMYLDSEFSGRDWKERSQHADFQRVVIDDLMSSQGSCWFMKKDYYHELELLDEESYGPFFKEFQEIGLKCWLSGGRVVINKKTWYAHWHKPKSAGRGYHLESSAGKIAEDQVRRWMKMGEAWHKQTLPIEWLVRKFWPVPTWSEQVING